MSVTAKVTGGRAMSKMFERMPAAAAREIAVAINETATAVMKTAKANAPVATGVYKKSIKVLDRAKAKFLRARVGSRDPKSHLIEYGYKHSTGRLVGGKYPLTRARKSEESAHMRRVSDAVLKARRIVFKSALRGK